MSGRGAASNAASCAPAAASAVTSSAGHHHMMDCRRTSSLSPARRRPPPAPPLSHPPASSCSIQRSRSSAACPRVPPRPAPGTFAVPRRPSDVTRAPVPVMRLSSEDEMRAAFRVFDLDNNGLIDSDELRLTMSRLGEVVTDADVGAMIRAVDRNNDGKVDYEGITVNLCPPSNSVLCLFRGSFWH